MNAGLTSGMGARPPRTKQFLPGLKWRVNTDPSNNILFQYAANGGAWATKFYISLMGDIYIGAQSVARLSYGGSDIILVNGTLTATNSLQISNLGDTYLTRRDAGVFLANGFIQWAGQKRVSTQFDVAASTTLANITGLTVNVAAGRTYNFRAVLHIAADAVGGIKFAMAGTATATAIIYQINVIANTSNANVITSRQIALGGSAGTAADTSYFAEIEGTITVNAAGTLTAQFSQNAASGTSSVLVGSTLTVFDVQ